MFMHIGFILKYNLSFFNMAKQDSRVTEKQYKQNSYGCHSDRSNAIPCIYLWLGVYNKSLLSKY